MAVIGLEWCSVGPGGSGYFWGSHGCTLGDHSEDPHIHACLNHEFDDNGTIVETNICCQIDDRTGMTRWNDEGEFDFDYGLGWWQGGKDNL